MATPPQSARKHHNLSALIARRAVREARKAKKRGYGAVAGVVAAHQLTSARESESAVGSILREIGFSPNPEARLILPAYTTLGASFVRMAEATDTDFEFDRLVASLVQEAGNAAEQVAAATREGVGWVRMLTPPSCSRCVALAGRVYRYSDGFLRHPQDDCVTIPAPEGDATFAPDPVELMDAGQVRGLSKADQEAIRDGADFAQVVNIRRKVSSLTVAGESLARAGRPTPAGIYRLASDRADALAMLARFGYIT